MDGFVIGVKDDEICYPDVVKKATGYTMGYLRVLEGQGKIPKALRDGNNYRYWLGKDVKEIKKYRATHHSITKKSRKLMEKTISK